MEEIIWTCPFAIVIDTREQTPWIFDGITKRINKQDVPVVIPTVRASLRTGDYSIVGFEDMVCIERKSARDLIKTVSQDRDRFERELARMQELDFAAVVIEEDWDVVMRTCLATTDYNPASLDSSIIAWQQRFKGTHWIWRPGRAYASKTTYKILDRWYRDRRKAE